jgi:dinuclear metal center YbgI/SA1388 family protein
MVKCADVISFMERLAPGELAENWDNTGLLVGDSKANIKKILLCLDVTMASIDEAIAQKANLIITHHPVIFDELKQLTEQDFKGKQLYKLIRNGLSVYSAHTNLDYVNPGVNTCLADVLGIRDAVMMGKGPGICGMLEKKMSFDEFTGHVKNSLQAPFLRVVGHAPSGIRKAAVFSGSFDGDLKSVIESGAEALVTGDLKYHTALDACEAGLCILDAGHFSTEKVVLPYLARRLGEQFPDVGILLCKDENDPFTYR